MSNLWSVQDEDLEGIVRCYCGVKYWENLHCADCGQKVDSDLLSQLSALV